MQPEMLPAHEPLRSPSTFLFVSRSVCIAVTDLSADLCTTRIRQGLQQRYNCGVVTVVLHLWQVGQTASAAIVFLLPSDVYCPGRVHAGSRTTVSAL